MSFGFGMGPGSPPLLICCMHTDTYTNNIYPTRGVRTCSQKQKVATAASCCALWACAAAWPCDWQQIDRRASLGAMSTITVDGTPRTIDKNGLVPNIRLSDGRRWTARRSPGETLEDFERRVQNKVASPRVMHISIHMRMHARLASAPRRCLTFAHCTGSTSIAHVQRSLGCGRGQRLVSQTHAIAKYGAFAASVEALESCEQRYREYRRERDQQQRQWLQLLQLITSKAAGAAGRRIAQRSIRCCGIKCELGGSSRRATECTLRSQHVRLEHSILRI